MISGSLAVEGPPRGLGLSVPGHHLHNTHPQLPFVTYHPHPTSQPSSTITHHHQLHQLSASGSISNQQSWNSVRAMVTSQPQSNVPSSIGSVAVSLSQHQTQQQKHAEFLMPLPKPLNRLSTNPSTNGLRPRVSKYSPPAASGAPNPVNLVQHKDEPTQEELYQSNVAAYAARMLHVPQAFSYANLQGPYGPTLYPPPYTPLLPRSPLESTYIPQQMYPNRPLLSHSQPPQELKSPKKISSETFKVPSGKEGSLKHRILTRPAPSASVVSDCVKKQVSPTSTVTSPTAVVSQSSNSGGSAAVSSPRTINNNTIIPMGFGRDSLIRLATGELKRVEDMRTEDFVKSAQQCPELRLADSTVVKIESNGNVGTARITLSYNQNRTQVIFLFFC